MNSIEGFENQIFARSFYSSIEGDFKLDRNLGVWNITTIIFLYTKLEAGWYCHRMQLVHVGM